MSGVGEFIDALDVAIASTRRRRAPALHLPVPSLWGVHGRRDRTTDEGAPRYAYTRAQCETLRGIIYASARADLARADMPPGDDHTP